MPVVSSPNDCATPADQINLLAYAKDPDSSSTTLATSGLIFNAAAEQRADLVVDRVSSYDDSEYQRLHGHLKHCLGAGDAFWDSLHGAERSRRVSRVRVQGER